MEQRNEKRGGEKFLFSRVSQHNELSFAECSNKYCGASQWRSGVLHLGKDFAVSFLVLKTWKQSQLPLKSVP